ncbi:MAG: hypothetical protein RLZZ236_455 [Bacteroidota bacterium]
MYNENWNFNNPLMKIFTLVLIVFASALLIFNATRLNFNDLFAGESMYALIGIAASFCAILILLIFRMSKEIEKRMNE